MDGAVTYKLSTFSAQPCWCYGLFVYSSDKARSRETKEDAILLREYDANYCPLVVLKLNYKLT
jgi:hypothetical protein